LVLIINLSSLKNAWRVFEKYSFIFIDWRESYQNLLNKVTWLKAGAFARTDSQVDIFPVNSSYLFQITEIWNVLKERVLLHWLLIEPTGRSWIDQCGDVTKWILLFFIFLTVLLRFASIISWLPSKFVCQFQKQLNLFP